MSNFNCKIHKCDKNCASPVWFSAVLRLLASSNFLGLHRSVNTDLGNKIKEETIFQLFVVYFFIFKALVCYKLALVTY